MKPVNNVHFWLFYSFNSEINFLDFQKSAWSADIAIREIIKKLKYNMG